MEQLSGFVFQGESFGFVCDLQIFDRCMGVHLDSDDDDLNYDLDDAVVI